MNDTENVSLENGHGRGRRSRVSGLGDPRTANCNSQDATEEIKESKQTKGQATSTTRGAAIYALRTAVRSFHSLIVLSGKDVARHHTHTH